MIGVQGRNTTKFIPVASDRKFEEETGETETN